MIGIFLFFIVIGIINGQGYISSAEEESIEIGGFETPLLPPMNLGPRAQIQIFGFRPEPRLPPFLKNASEETRNGFHRIFTNQSLTFTEKKAQIDQLIEGENEVVKAEFEKFKKAMEERKQRMEQRHKEAVSKLSKEAQEADSKIMQLFKNESITYSDRRQMLREIFENLPENVRNELKSLRPPGRFGGRFGKCCKGIQWPIRFGKMIKIDHFKGTNGLRNEVPEVNSTVISSTATTAAPTSTTAQTNDN